MFPFRTAAQLGSFRPRRRKKGLPGENPGGLWSRENRAAQEQQQPLRCEITAEAVWLASLPAHAAVPGPSAWYPQPWPGRPGRTSE
jgi:hypothetical protein